MTCMLASYTAGTRLHQTLCALPAGNSVFFTVKRIEDPIGLLPAKLILGINKRGVHFFRPVPKEYLHSAELRDIMQFGSSSQAVFFKMRVAGVLHIFQFDTKQGEDICMALQTHINDIMMKRYSKVSFCCLFSLQWFALVDCFIAYVMNNSLFLLNPPTAPPHQNKTALAAPVVVSLPYNVLRLLDCCCPHCHGCPSTLFGTSTL